MLNKIAGRNYRLFNFSLAFVSILLAVFVFGWSDFLLKLNAISHFPPRGVVFAAQVNEAMHDNAVGSKRQNARKQINKSSQQHAIPNYFEYIELAERKGWHPINPIEKIESIISQYGTFGSASDAVDDAEMIALYNMSVSMMRQQELAYMLEVIKQPTHHDVSTEKYRSEVNSDGSSHTNSNTHNEHNDHQSDKSNVEDVLDLNHLFTLAVETAQKCVYSHMKAVLDDKLTSSSDAASSRSDNNMGDSTHVTITKSKIESMLSNSNSKSSSNSNNCYVPIRMLLKLAGERKNEEDDYQAAIIVARRKLQRKQLESQLKVIRNKKIVSVSELATDVPLSLLSVKDSRKLSHLNVDVDMVSASVKVNADQQYRQQASLLELVVRCRLYRILPAVIEYMSNPDDIVIYGMRNAVRNRYLVLIYI
jgi:hypothetical protein